MDLIPQEEKTFNVIFAMLLVFAMLLALMAFTVGPCSDCPVEQATAKEAPEPVGAPCASYEEGHQKMSAHFKTLTCRCLCGRAEYDDSAKHYVCLSPMFCEYGE